MWGRQQALLAAIAVIGSVSACGSGDDDGAQTTVASAIESVAETDATSAPTATDPPVTESVETDPPVTEPVATDPPVTEPVVTDPPVTDPVEIDPPTTDLPTTEAAAVPSGPLPLENGPLLAGSTYRSPSQATDVTFTIPAELDEGDWVAGFVNPVRFVLTAIAEGGTRNFDPGFEIAAVADIATVDDVVATITAYAAVNETFEVIAEVGMFRGEEVTVLRGSSTAPGQDVLEIPTSEFSAFLLPTEPREFLAYLLQAPTQLVVAKLDAHPDEFDFLVERVAPVLDSLVFE